MEKRCYKCGRTKNLNEFQQRRAAKDGRQKLCRECMNSYNRTHRKETGYKRPVGSCHMCGVVGPIYGRDTDGALCQKHYRENYLVPLKPCSLCGNMAPVALFRDGIPVCMRCYHTTYKAPQEICVMCGEARPVAKRRDSEPVCRRCHKNWRYETDELFRLKEILKNELLHAFKTYSFCGKQKHAKQYGIDYGAILEHLGSCPGKRQSYHIDHVFPLSAFDFDDVRQVKAAFAPENHQWLLAKENLSKQDKYDELAFADYLKRFLTEGELHD